MLDDCLTVIHLKFRPYPKNSDAANEGGSASTARTPIDSPRSSRSLEKNVSLNPMACMGQGRCGAGTASVQGYLLAVGTGSLASYHVNY